MPCVAMNYPCPSLTISLLSLTMTKLDYVLSEEDIETVRKMVKDRNPVVACIELDMKEAKARYV